MYQHIYGKENEKKDHKKWMKPLVAIVVCAALAAICGVMVYTLNQESGSGYAKMESGKDLKSVEADDSGVLNDTVKSVTRSLHSTIEDNKKRASADEKEKIKEKEEAKKAQKAKEVDYLGAANDVCDMIRNNYGSASGETFVSSSMASLQSFPLSAGGYTNHFWEDLDQDGINELIIAYIDSADWMLHIQLYKYVQNAYQLQSEIEAGNIDAFSQINTYLFWNEWSGTYQIVYSNNIVGSYTGTTGFSVKIYSVSQSIEELYVWEWNDSIGSIEQGWEIQGQIKEAGIPYLELGRFSFGEYDKSNNKMLAKTQISVEGDMPSTYTVSMCILNCEQMEGI